MGPFKLFFLAAVVMVLAVADAQQSTEIECKSSDVTFELMTGYVFTSPGEILETKPDTLQLADCIESCRSNDTCRALNFETGLCVLFKSNAIVTPGKLLLFWRKIFYSKVLEAGGPAASSSPETFSRAYPPRGRP